VQTGLSRGGAKQRTIEALRSPGTALKTRRPLWSSYRGTVLGLALLAATRLALADQAHDGSRVCEAASPEQAKPLADVLYENGEYQRAGACYQAAGDRSRAQSAFLKAVGPNNEANARAFREQQDAAKSLFTKMQQAFRRGH
jgi:hypothetical protein